MQQSLINGYVGDEFLLINIGYSDVKQKIKPNPQ